MPHFAFEQIEGRHFYGAMCILCHCNYIDLPTQPDRPKEVWIEFNIYIICKYIRFCQQDKLCIIMVFLQLWITNVYTKLNIWIWILLYVAFCTIMAISRLKEARSLQGFFIVHNTIGSTVHSMPLNSLEHCICITTMTNIRPDRDSNLVPPGYKPQSIRMSHRGRPTLNWKSGYVLLLDNVTLSC